MKTESALDGMRLRVGSWEALAGPCTLVRDAVFVVEQGVQMALEHDGHDAQCIHVLAMSGGNEPIGTGRLRPDGHIGRLAVLKHWRGMGAGAAILALLIEEARGQGHCVIDLNAQIAATDFYRAFGFKPVGETFFEAGLKHQAMRLNLD